MQHQTLPNIDFYDVWCCMEIDDFHAMRVNLHCMKIGKFHAKSCVHESWRFLCTKVELVSLHENRSFLCKESRAQKLAISVQKLAASGQVADNSLFASQVI